MSNIVEFSPWAERSATRSIPAGNLDGDLLPLKNVSASHDVMHHGVDCVCILPRALSARTFKTGLPKPWQCSEAARAGGCGERVTTGNNWVRVHDLRWNSKKHWRRNQHG